MSDRLLEILVNSFGKILLAGVKITIPLTILSFALSLVIGLLLALICVAKLPVLKQLANLYIWIFRGTPLIVQLFIVFFGLPNIGITLKAFPAAVIAFGMNLGAYNAETIRASIQAIPKGQSEAGYLVGLTRLQTMRRIIIPQAFPIAFPTLSNNLIGLLKDTSLASCITVVELFTVTQQTAARTYDYFALYLEAAVVYLIFSTILTWLQRVIERRLVFESKEGRSVRK